MGTSVKQKLFPIGILKMTYQNDLKRGKQCKNACMYSKRTLLKSGIKISLLAMFIDLRQFSYTVTD